MHPIQSQPRPSGHFDSLSARKYPKILVTIRAIVCYTISSKGEHRATPERREHEMKYKVTNPNRGIWEVYEADKYEAAENGVNIFDTEEYAALKAKLVEIRVATFKTRKAAREYIASIGGTY